MESTADIRYAGVVVGRGSAVRDLDAGGAFVGLAEPLPVGTLVSLKIGDDSREARVVEVVESADAGAAGMRVRFVGSGEVEAVPQEMSGAVSSGISADGGGQPGAGDGGGRRRRKRR